MNILVLGGSYFLGRYFVNISCNNKKITVFNRGNCTLNMPSVTEVKGDRHVSQDVQKLAETDFDVIVDFCAYKENDILSIVNSLQNIPKQYIFVSTVDVYERGTGKVLAEDADFETREFPGPEGEYITGKIILEKELREAAKEYGFKYTVIRPAFIYGPGNYAPREGIYFDWISQARQILHPVDATGEFQFVYVMDVAKAIDAALCNDFAYDEAFNLVCKDVETYDSFAEALKDSTDVSFDKIDIPLGLVYEKGIPLPFPLTKAESNCYNGEKALKLIGEYTRLKDGLKKTALVMRR